MLLVLFFFFNDPATTEIYTLSLHDALPILDTARAAPVVLQVVDAPCRPSLGVLLFMAVTALVTGTSLRTRRRVDPQDRKSTRLNSSHMSISYAVFCLKKKNNDRSNSSVLYF